MADVGGVITSQVDLLWSVALALLLAEIYLVARLFRKSGVFVAGIVPQLLLYSSIVLQSLSMMFGYLTYGSIIILLRCGPGADGTIDRWCEENNITEATAFSNSENVAFLQFAAFGVGLLLFILLFMLRARAIADAME